MTEFLRGVRSSLFVISEPSPYSLNPYSLHHAPEWDVSCPGHSMCNAAFNLLSSPGTKAGKKQDAVRYYHNPQFRNLNPQVLSHKNCI